MVLWASYGQLRSLAEGGRSHHVGARSSEEEQRQVESGLKYLGDGNTHHGTISMFPFLYFSAASSVGVYLYRMDSDRKRRSPEAGTNREKGCRN